MEEVGKTEQTIQSPTLQQPETKQRHSFLPHSFVGIGVIILSLLAIAYASYYFFLDSQLSNLFSSNNTVITPTPSQNPTNDWKTYTDNQYNLTFSYPSDWRVTIRDERSKGGSYFVGIRPISPKPESETFNLVFIGITKWEKTVDDYINNNLCDSPDICASADKAEKVLIDGIAAKKIINPPAPIPTQIILLKKDSLLYSFEIILDKSYDGLLTENEKIEIFDQILSTFKFLGTSPTPTCIPRPACLDTEPRCMIPETEGMCPPKTPTPKSQDQVFCTQDAKLCPDGSYVGRTGPNCEFAVCPGE